MRKILTFIVIVLLFLLSFQVFTDFTVTADSDDDFWVPYTAPGMIGQGYRINYSLAWHYIKNHVQHLLEARTNGDWFETSGLSILYKNFINNTVKFTLQFNATEGDPRADYRLTLLLDIPELDVSFDTVNKTLIMTKVAFNHTFILRLDYSDIADIPGLVFSKGELNDRTWFRIERDNTPNGVYVLDPEYQIQGESGSTYYPNGRKLAISTDGVLYCIYEEIVSGIGTMTNVYIAHSHDYGETWTNIQLTYSNYPDCYELWNSPSIAIDSNNLVHIVYANQTGATTYKLYYRTYNHTTNVTTAEVQISDSITWIIGTCSVAIDSSNNIHVAWSQTRTSGKLQDVRYRKNTAGSWGTVVNLSTEGSALTKNQLYPTLIIDTSNNLYVYWSGEKAALGTEQIRVKKYWNGNSTWSKRINVTATTNRNLDLSACVNSTGKVFIAYEARDALAAGKSWIYFKNSSNGLSFGTASNLSYTKGAVKESTPSVACDNSSKVHVVWCGLRTGDTRNSLQYKNTSNGGSTWGAMLNLSIGNPASNLGMESPNLLWATFPIKTGKHPDILKKGWSLIYTNGSATGAAVYFMKSVDVIWNTTGGPYVTYVYPANESTGIDHGPVCAVTVNTPLAQTMTVTWFENSTDSYIQRQVNTSVAPGSTVRYHYTYAIQSLHTYWWKVYVDDGTTNNSFIYHFQICGNPLITNPEPANESTGISLQPKTNITVNDPTGDEMTIRWLSNATSEPFVFRPDGVGNHTELLTGGTIGATYGWQCVDDVVSDEWNTVVWYYNEIPDSDYHFDTYRTQNHTTQTFVIYNLTVHARLNGYCGEFPVNNYAKITIRTSAGHYYNGSTITVPGTDTWNDYKFSFLVNNETGIAWTWDDIDALEIGVSLRKNNDYCTQVYAEVNPGSTSGWYEYGRNSSVTNETYRQNGTYFDTADTTYWWQVIVNDSSFTNTSDIFHFTTVGGNSLPQLTLTAVYPTTGVASYTSFQFNVTWADNDGDDPTDGYLTINISRSGWYVNTSMTWISGSNTTGAKYEYTTTLTTGSYAYQFWAYDGTGYNSTSSYNNPTVNAQSYAIGVTACNTKMYFNMSSFGTGGSQSNVAADGQTSVIPALEIENQGNVPINLTINISALPDACLTLKWDADNNPVGATTVTTSYVLIQINLSVSSSKSIWLWMDFVSCPPGTGERTLTITSSSGYGW